MPSPKPSARIGAKFFRRPAIELAKALLGQSLARRIDGNILAGRIVEVEAYLGIEDIAAHTFGGRRTPRNESMWQDGGHLYVYFTYGMHHCANVVASVAGDPVAVLLRALEPTDGIDTMFQHRAKARKATDLCSGPARLCQAMRIDRSLDRTYLPTNDAVWIAKTQARPLPESAIVTRPRVGIAYAGEWAEKPLRFYLRDNPHVSKR